ncbi:MAG: ribosome maturation factor RimP [Clostridia bacterium]|nr:ribosome maturation factor RimP [Clostridia bacterium]
MAVADVVRPLVLPITQAHGLILWDIEFVKEGTERFLRVYIDREEGGIGIEDCEAVSRALDPILDEVDPIPQSYHLEICSAGLIRDLKTTDHIQRFLGLEAEVRLYKGEQDLPKKFNARLDSVTDEALTVTVADREYVLDRKLISKIKIDLI